MELTTEEMLTEIWAHRFKDDPKLMSEIEDEDFDEGSVAEIIGYTPKVPVPVVDVSDVNDWESL